MNEKEVYRVDVYYGPGRSEPRVEDVAEIVGNLALDGVHSASRAIHEVHFYVERESGMQTLNKVLAQLKMAGYEAE